MKISQFSKISGISLHTLRYYEKIGLLTHIQRNKSGHREFSLRDKEKILFIIKLKNTAMPLKETKGYLELIGQGDITLKERKNLLEEHLKKLKKRIKEQRHYESALENKLLIYKEKIKHSLDLE